jgi:hypothetical protein
MIHALRNLYMIAGLTNIWKFETKRKPLISEGLSFSYLGVIE